MYELLHSMTEVSEAFSRRTGVRDCAVKVQMFVDRCYWLGDAFVVRFCNN